MIITLIERLSRFAGILSALTVLPLVAALIIEVFCRYVLASPTLWAFEVSYMTMGAMFMLAMAHALQQDAHVSVDVVTLHLSFKTNRLIRLVAYLLLLPVMLWLTLELFDYFREAMNSGERSGRSAWNPVMWPVYLSWFTGFLLLSLQIVAEILKCLLFLKKGEAQNTADEQKEALQ